MLKKRDSGLLFLAHKHNSCNPVSVLNMWLVESRRLSWNVLLLVVSRHGRESLQLVKMLFSQFVLI